MPLTRQEVIAAATPNSAAVTSRVIDLSIARSPADGTCLVLTISGKYIRNSADKNVGGAQISLDAAGTKNNLTNNNFYLSQGDAIKNVPFERITIANTAQPGKFLYLSISDSVELNVQAITGDSDVEGTLAVRNKSTSGGVTLLDIPGKYGGNGTETFDNADFVMSQDEESANREWVENLKRASNANGANGIGQRQYGHLFQSNSGSYPRNTTTYAESYLTTGQTGNLLGGNRGTETFYKVRAHAHIFSGGTAGGHVADMGLVISGGAANSVILILRPKITEININVNAQTSGGNDEFSDITCDFPPFKIPTNRTNNSVVLRLLFAPTIIGGNGFVTVNFHTIYQQVINE